MESITVGNKRFNLHHFNLEKEIEKRVIENYKFIFGENCLFFPLKERIESSYGIKGIPDGFIIDLNSNKFFVVEIELVEHGFYQHMLGQITLFANAFKREENKRKITDALFESLKPEDKEKIKLKIKTSEIYQYIHNLVFSKNFGIIVVINEKTKDLDDLREDYINNLENIEFKTYKSNGDEIYKIDWLFKEEEIDKMGEEKKVFKTYDREDNLKRANPQVKEAFEKLESEIIKLPRVKEPHIGDHYFDYRIEGSKKGTFASVNIRKDRLLILIKMGKKKLNDSKGISVDVSSEWGYGDLTKKFSIDSKEDVNYAMTLIRQAYEYTKQ